MAYNSNYVPGGKNSRDNRYYRKQNHVRLAKRESSRDGLFPQFRPSKMSMDIGSTTGYDLAITTSDGSDWTHRGASFLSGLAYQTFGADSGQFLVTGDIGVTVTQFRSTNGDLGFDIADLPSSLADYIHAGPNTTYGNISGLPTGLTNYQNYGTNTTTGDIASLPKNLLAYINRGANTTYGDIGALPSNLAYYDNRGSNTCTMTLPWSMATVNFNILRQIGSQALPQSVVDFILSEADTKVVNWVGEQTIDVSGNNAAPTGGASNANILSLQAKGVTVVFNT